MIVLEAIGKFFLKDDNGRDLTPRGAKSKALMLLLALAPQHRRTRHWLQSKLWSDRAPEQAASSLRMALTDIRRSLGANNAFLLSDRQTISLDPKQLIVSYAIPDGAILGEDIEPFEDIDVADAEFEHLLRNARLSIVEKRRALAIQPKVSASHLLLLKCADSGGSAAAVCTKLFQAKFKTATKDAENLVVSQVQDELDVVSQGNTGASATLSLVSICVNDRVFVSVELTLGRNRRQIFSENAIVPARLPDISESSVLDGIALRTGESLLNALCDCENELAFESSPLALARTARSLGFKLDKESLKAADDLLRIAFERTPRGSFLAWRAFLRNSAFFQHRDVDFLGGLKEAQKMIVQALQMSPSDPLVEALSSQFEYIHESNLKLSLKMAQRSIEANSTNPMGWAIYSNALTINEKQSDGYAAALRAIELSKGSSNEFYFEHFGCMAASALCDYDLALLHAQSALSKRPDFVSARRYEIALLHTKNDYRKLASSIDVLRQSEPEFSAGSFRESNYPVSTMRRLKLIEAIP